MWIEIPCAALSTVQNCVTPYAGVWIEIANFSKNSVPANVTPYAGVWIEIISDITFVGDLASLPTRECGLKFKEIDSNRLISSHSLRGSVD